MQVSGIVNNFSFTNNNLSRNISNYSNLSANPIYKTDSIILTEKAVPVPPFPPSEEPPNSDPPKKPWFDNKAIVIPLYGSIFTGATTGIGFLIGKALGAGTTGAGIAFGVGLTLASLWGLAIWKIAD